MAKKQIKRTSGAAVRGRGFDLEGPDVAELLGAADGRSEALFLRPWTRTCSSAWRAAVGH